MDLYEQFPPSKHKLSNHFSDTYNGITALAAFLGIAAFGARKRLFPGPGEKLESPLTRSKRIESREQNITRAFELARLQRENGSLRRMSRLPLVNAYKMWN